MTRYSQPELEQHKEAIKNVVFFDFMKTMGQYALEIEYTNGDKQMFTTKSHNPNHSGYYEFETVEEMLNFKSNL